MYIFEYLKDKAGVLLGNITGLFLLLLYLWGSKLPTANLILIAICWLLILIVYFCQDYFRLCKKIKKMYDLLDHLEKKYLLGEVMDSGTQMTDRIYRDLIKRSNRSVIEEVHQLEQEHMSYREYIEGWIHEVKTPITAIQLMCENQKNDTTKRIMLELGQIEDEVENVLYYARSDNVYQDFMIHPVNLKSIVLEAISRSKRYFIQNNMQITFNVPDYTLPTDDKWILYLLNQFFKNAIQYRATEDPCISIYLEQHVSSEQNVVLVIEDNGIGIPDTEINRVFEKGFTGSNGRNSNNTTGKATGMGLYLAKKLSDRLEIGLRVESKLGKGTRIKLIFPNSDYQRILQK